MGEQVNTFVGDHGQLAELGRRHRVSRRENETTPRNEGRANITQGVSHRREEDSNVVKQASNLLW